MNFQLMNFIFAVVKYISCSLSLIFLFYTFVSFSLYHVVAAFLFAVLYDRLRKRHKQWLVEMEENLSALDEDTE